MRRMHRNNFRTTQACPKLQARFVVEHEEAFPFAELGLSVVQGAIEHDQELTLTCRCRNDDEGRIRRKASERRT